MTDHKRRTLGVSELPCDICGGSGLTIIESRTTRHGLNLVNPVWHASCRTYELCPSCGVKYPLKGGRRV